jgi:protein-tyrosine phosphatase
MSAHLAAESAGLLADPRHLPLSGTFNVRDAGGYRTASGGEMRTGLLIRADALGRLDDAGRAALAELRIRTVIDLREDAERDITPDALDGLDAVLVANPLFAGRRPEVGNLAAVYEMLVDQCGDTITAAVRRLAAPGALPAMVHCTAGKDRTGVVVALAHAIAGVSDEDICADYAQTSRYLSADFLVAIGRGTAGSGMTDELLAMATACPPELILDTLDRIRARSGSIEAYLLSHGASADELAALRSALTAS